MYEEEFEDGTHYTRLEQDDFDKIRGKRINGRGKIVGYTVARGELHPCLIHIEGGDDITADELPYVDFDGRHGFVEV
jgi:hypothetical protein